MRTSHAAVTTSSLDVGSPNTQTSCNMRLYVREVQSADRASSRQELFRAFLADFEILSSQAHGKSRDLDVRVEQQPSVATHNLEQFSSKLRNIKALHWTRDTRAGRSADPQKRCKRWRRASKRPRHATPQSAFSSLSQNPHKVPKQPLGCIQSCSICLVPDPGQL